MTTAVSAGEAMFARYAYPPNELGYCGPGDGGDLLDVAHAASDPASAGRPALDVPRRARAFDGAWPYLDYLARACGAGSALDARVVEAYWVGNDLLDECAEEFPAAARQAFADQRGADWAALEPTISPRPVPHHSFHVFSIYPWVSILRRTGSEQALQVLDRCRIRWGRIDAIHADQAEVQYQPLTWNGTVLGLGAPRPELVRLGAGGRRLAPTTRPGQWVSLHWDWVCDQLEPDQLAALRAYTARQLSITNQTG